MAHKIAKLPVSVCLDHQEVELVGNGSSRGGLENFFSVYPRNTGAQGAGRDDAKHLTREEPGRGKDDGWQETTPLTYGGGGVGDSHGGSIHGGGAEKCSTVKALGHIFISFVGAGVLGLPYAFRRSGMLLGAGFMSLLACLALHAMLLLVQCKRRLEHEGVATYSDIASYALGRFGRRLVETLLVTSQCGFCVAYLVFISKNLASVTGASEAGIVMLLVPPLIALAVLRSLTALAPFSLLADAANVMGMLVVLRDDVLEFKSNAPTLASAGISALPFLFGVVIYCYEGIGMILPIEASMEDRDKFPAVLSMGVFIITGIFITFGMVGYAAYGPNTQDIITSNLPDDWTSTTVKLSLCVGLFFTFPVMLIPVYEIAERAVVSTGWFERNVSPNRRWSVLRVGRATIVTSIALFSIGVPGFGLFISLVGSLCCATLAFVIPAACHLVIFRSKNDLSTWGLVADISLVVFGLIGTVFGVSRTLSDIIERTAA